MFFKRLEQIIRNVSQASRIRVEDRRSGEDRRRTDDRRQDERSGEHSERRSAANRRV